MNNQDDLKKIKELKELVLYILNSEIIPLQKQIATVKNTENEQLKELTEKYNKAAENFIPKYDELLRLCKSHGIGLGTTLLNYKTPLN